MDPFLQTEGRIVRELGIVSVIITSGLPIIELGGRGGGDRFSASLV